MDPKVVAAIDEAATRRRSVRDFRPEPIDEREVAGLLALAARAPSAWNLQPWRFIVVTDPEARKRLRAAANDQRQVEGAPVVVVIYTDMVDALERVDATKHPAMPLEAFETVRANILRAFASKTPEERDRWGRAQGYIVLGYLLLLLEVHGLGSSPMVGFDPAKVRALFDLPAHAEIPALVAIGHPASSDPPAPQHRHAIESLVRYVGAASGSV